ncbi:MAG: DciA family protein [Rhodobacteraceae bacterium]|nr:DciA family protein [Paracoccaceae bacterium]
MKPKRSKRQDEPRRARGFAHASEFIMRNFRTAAEKRGFASTRLLTAWKEIAGAEIARSSEPVDVRFDPRTETVTLTLLTTGAFAEQVKMSVPVIIERVNAAYGYKAVDRIRVSQTWKGMRAKRLSTPPKPGEARRLQELIAESPAIDLSGIEDAETRCSLAEFGSLIHARYMHSKEERE